MLHAFENFARRYSNLTDPPACPPPPGMQAVLYAFENFARRMVHQFPTNPTARVCLGLMLRRRACHDGSTPVPQVRRQLPWRDAGRGVVYAVRCAVHARPGAGEPDAIKCMWWLARLALGRTGSTLTTLPPPPTTLPPPPVLCRRCAARLRSC